jgi:hypothetical protein
MTEIRWIYNNHISTLPEQSQTNKCIVLDLDQTLIATQDDEYYHKLFELGVLSDPSLLELRNRIFYFTVEDFTTPGSGTTDVFWGVSRPHVHEFLVFCYSYFRMVAVWSAGGRRYVESIVDYLFKDLPYPTIVYSADDTVITPRKTEKPLIKMIDQFAEMDVTNTLIVDDNQYTFVHNVDNAILIPAYEPGVRNKKGYIVPTIEGLMEDDIALQQLKYWFLLPEVANSEDVAQLDKDNIFTTSIEEYQRRIPKIISSPRTSPVKSSPRRTSPRKN